MAISAAAAALIAIIAAALVGAELAYSRRRHRRRATKARKAAEALLAEDDCLRTRSQHARNARRSEGTSISDARGPITIHPSAQRTNTPVSTEKSAKVPRSNFVLKVKGMAPAPAPKPVTASPDYETAEMRYNGVAIRDFAYPVRC